jgi:hypothetical protein
MTKAETYAMLRLEGMTDAEAAQAIGWERSDAKCRALWAKLEALHAIDPSITPERLQKIMGILERQRSGYAERLRDSEVTMRAYAIKLTSMRAGEPLAPENPDTDLGE